MFREGSQNDRIVRYMKKNGGITTMDAFLELGVTRLASRICEITKEGYQVCGRDVKVPTRTGKMAIVKEYSLC